MFINSTDIIGQIIGAGTTGLTGDVVASLYIIIIFLLAVCMIFQIPLEFMCVIILPICLAIASYYSNFMIPVVLIIIYVSALIAKNWLFR